MSEETSAPAPKTTPQMGYGAIAGIVISETDKFLEALANQLKNEPLDSVRTEFLMNFLLQADSYSASCCNRFAATLRQLSTLAEIRETEEAVLSRLVRNRCFDSLDTTLVNFVDTLRRLNLNLRSTLDQLTESKVKELGTGSPEGAAGGEAGAKKAIPPQKLKGYGILQVWEYLRKMDGLPHECIDYGSYKLFSGDHDYEIQRGFQQNIKDSVQEKSSLVMTLVEAFEAVKERKWSELRAAEEANIRFATMAAGQQSVKRKTRISSLVIGMLCTIPTWVLSSVGASNPYFVMLGVTSGVIAIFFFYRGIASFTKA